MCPLRCGLGPWLHGGVSSGEQQMLGSNSSRFLESLSSTATGENGPLLPVQLVAADWEELSCFV